MKRNKTTTEMRYQVEGANSVIESRCYSLREAFFIFNMHKNRSCNRAVNIARYDTSGYSNYYEIIHTVL